MVKTEERSQAQSFCDSLYLETIKITKHPDSVESVELSKTFQNMNNILD